MNKTMENAMRYLPKPCEGTHNTVGCYKCMAYHHSDTQGAITIAQGLIDEGYPAFIKHEGGYNMVVYVYGSFGKAIGCTAESGVVFYPDIHNREEFFYLTGPDYIPSYEGCTSESLAMILDTVMANDWRLEMGADAYV